MKNQNKNILSFLMPPITTVSFAAIIWLLIVIIVKKTDNRRLAYISFWNKQSLTPIQKSDIDFFAGHRSHENSSTRAMQSRYDDFVPANAANKMHYLQPRLDVSRLAKTHVMDILSVNYRQELNSSVLLKNIVSNTQKNICALSCGIGQPFATALLIAPDLIFTARHSVEKLSVRSINARQEYQLNDNGMNYGNSLEIAEFAENNPDLDYAILKLKEPVSNFKPINFCFTDNVVGNTIFIHHPDGGPKKVSVHESLDSDFQKISYNGFHDSWKGSSGGVYLDTEGRVFALHLLHDNQTTSAVWIKDIYQNSMILCELFHETGIYKNVQKKFSATSENFLQASKLSKEYHRQLEKKLNTIILGMPNLSYFSRGVSQSRHHIIPDGNMQFLWLIGQECEKLKQILAEMAYQCDERNTINATEWSPWNLFIGPSNRSDDPHDGNELEKVRPSGFSEKLWDALKKLNRSICNCWDIRYALANNQLHTLSAFKKNTMDMLGTYDSKTKILNKDGVLNFEKSLKKRYTAEINKIIDRLKCIKVEYKKVAHNKTNYIYQTTQEDWLCQRHGKFRL